MSDPNLPAWSEPFADPRGQLTRSLRLRGVTREWAWGGATGAGVRVGIIDSGLENAHPMLRGRVVENVTVEMTEVDLVSIRVLGADLRGKGTAFAAGLEWAIQQGLEVCNLSLSSKSESLYPVFHDLADQAYFKSMALVSAANNVPAPSYPSLFSSVFSVAAHAEPDPWRLYHNPSPPVEFGAWGVDVPIAWKDGGSTVATGNSFAAPHVAGLVALIVSKHPGLTPFEIKAILASVADNPGRRHPWRRRTAPEG
jgi:subtilisin